MAQKIEDYVLQFDSDIQAIVLGCTHYPIIHHHIEAVFPYTPIIDPGYESAQKFWKYLHRHPEIEKHLSRGGEMKFFTSGGIENFIRIGGGILEDNITLSTFSCNRL